MVKSQRNKPEAGRVKGQRYGSIMLVGEHGRVIPFRRFKEIAIAVIAVACLSLGALAVIAYLYARQAETIDVLQRELDASRRQITQLKDEKDILHAKLVIYEMQVPEAAQKSKGKQVGQGSPKPAATPGASTPKPQEPPPTVATSPPPQPTPASTPKVNWAVDLQQFNAQYDTRLELTRFTIRVVNKSSPKNPFSGRIVLVLKQVEASPKSWISLPNVPLEKGRPTGNNGQAFTVRNYRTMDFKLYQRPSLDYDTATVFVFSSAGELLSSRDFSFKIKVPPPPTATPTPEVEASPAPAPSPDPTPSVPAVTPSAPPIPETEAAAGNSVGNSSSGSGSPDVRPATPSPEQPQTTATPTVPAPAVDPVPVPEKDSEAGPKR